MIIKGLILTDKGPVDISETKVGNMVLNDMHRPHKVLSIEREDIKGGYTFSKNPNLILGKKSIIRTLYGDVALTGKKVNIVTLQPNMRQIKDIAINTNKTYTAYKLRLEDSNTLYVSNYCVVITDD